MSGTCHPKEGTLGQQQHEAGQHAKQEDKNWVQDGIVTPFVKADVTGGPLGAEEIAVCL